MAIRVVLLIMLLSPRLFCETPIRNANDPHLMALAVSTLRSLMPQMIEIGAVTVGAVGSRIGLLILPNASHFAFLQDPELFNYAATKGGDRWASCCWVGFLARSLPELRLVVDRVLRGHARYPPSTFKAAPVTKLVSGLARKATIAATSSAWPNRLSGTRFLTAAEWGPSAGFISVSVGPG